MSRKETSKFKKKARSVFIYTFWAYVLIKLFIFDFDYYIVSNFAPDLLWALHFKFFILLSAFAAVVAIYGTKNLIMFIGHMLVFEHVKNLWNGASYLLKYGNTAFWVGVSKALATIYYSFKFNFVVYTLLTLSFLITLKSENKHLLAAAALGGFALLIACLYRRFLYFFRKTVLNEFLFKLKDKVTIKHFAGIESQVLVPTQNLSEITSIGKANQIEQLVIYNRLCLLASKKVKSYQNNHVSYFYYILIIVVLTLQTSLTFTSINLALLKIDNSLFSFKVTPDLFTIFEYSCSTLIRGEIDLLKANSPITRFINGVACFCIGSIVGLILSLLINVRESKQEKQLEEVISHFEAETAKTEGMLVKAHNLQSVDEALVEIRKIEDSILKIFLFITNYLKKL